MSDGCWMGGSCDLDSGNIGRNFVTDYCKKCHTGMWHWQPPHECTEFFITDDYGENDSFWVENPTMILRDNRRFPTFEEAAEAWARNYNEDGDYSLMDETVEISIRLGDETKKFRVGAEPDIHYSIEELEPIPTAAQVIDEPADWTQDEENEQTRGEMEDEERRVFNALNRPR